MTPPTRPRSPNLTPPSDRWWLVPLTILTLASLGAVAVVLVRSSQGTKPKSGPASLSARGRSETTSASPLPDMDPAKRERPKADEHAAYPEPATLASSGPARAAHPGASSASVAPGNAVEPRGLAKDGHLGWERDRQLPWNWPGFCANESREDGVRRLRYLSEFVPTPVWQTMLYAHPNAPAEALAAVETRIESTHLAAVRYLALRARPSNVYLHPNVEALRAHSCAGREALAYYDGSIHLALPTDVRPEFVVSELRTSLMHEYVHHVLVSNGIGRPVWLQESLAMYFALERPGHGWRSRPLPLEAMIEAFPATAPPELESSFYGQAYAMLEFLRRLCAGRVGCRDAELVLALEQGRTTPETLFEWAISERAADITSAAPRAFWNEYVEHGNFSARTSTLLTARALQAGASR